MTRNLHRSVALCLIAWLGLALVAGVARADSTDSTKKAKTEGVVGGLLIDLKDDGIMVQVDKEDDETKFLYNGAITKEALLKQHIFNVDRVNVKFKMEGDDRKIVAIEKVTGKPSGVMVGTVLKVYNNFWVAVKPKTGMIEGFALNGSPEKVKPVADVLNALKPGDVVAIKYATDFERHRILQMEVRPAPSTSK